MRDRPSVPYATGYRVRESVAGKQPLRRLHKERIDQTKWSVQLFQSGGRASRVSSCSAASPARYCCIYAVDALTCDPLRTSGIVIAAAVEWRAGLPELWPSRRASALHRLGKVKRVELAIGKGKHGDMVYDVPIIYKVTSGGSAVVETIEQGSAAVCRLPSWK
jgi:hypothetical protein